MTLDARPITRSISWELRPTAQFPAGRLTLVVAPSAKRLRVHVAHVSIPERAGAAARSDSFDDGAVVVDRDAGGLVTGVEFLGAERIEDLPEFRREIGRVGADGLLLGAAHTTAMVQWVRFSLLFDVEAMSGTAAATRSQRAADGNQRMDELIERVTATLARARPDTNRWKSNVGPELATLA